VERLDGTPARVGGIGRLDEDTLNEAVACAAAADASEMGEERVLAVPEAQRAVLPLLDADPLPGSEIWLVGYRALRRVPRIDAIGRFFEERIRTARAA